MYVKKVTPKVYAAVLLRDRTVYWGKMYIRGTLEAFLASEPRVCMAPIIEKWPLVDLNVEMNCWGKSTLDHVKDDPRTGKRATSDEHHLVTLCEGHTEAGARSGYQWNTSHRDGEREYLRRVYGVDDRDDE